MSIETVVVTKLEATSGVTDIVGTTGIYPILAPQGTSLPYVTYQVVTGTPLNDTGGEGGTSNVTIQIDNWASSYSGVKALAAAVRAALSTWADAGNNLNTLLTSEIDNPEMPRDGSESPTHRVIQEFSIWYAA